MAGIELTEGSCLRLTDPHDEDILEFPHVLQLLLVRLLPKPTANTIDRYQLVLSDGIRYTQMVMLTSSLSHLVVDGVLVKGTVVVADRWARSNVHGIQLLVVLSLSILSGPHEKIGAPSPIATPATLPAQSSLSRVNFSSIFFFISRGAAPAASYNIEMVERKMSLLPAAVSLPACS
ncbi:hypothetical protein BD779DRAFT_1550809 [Infundibulicybe gibba]|nr:hypothetical protein BD779DRAFT_1550809 [Infundibulicybe gibba]